MRNVRPQVKAEILDVAKDQPEYLPVEVARVDHPDFPKGIVGNTALMAFSLDRVEIERLLNGDHLYVGLLCGNGRQQPINIFIGKEEAAQCYDLEVEVDPSAKSVII